MTKRTTNRNTLDQKSKQRRGLTSRYMSIARIDKYNSVMALAQLIQAYVLKCVSLSGWNVCFWSTWSILRSSSIVVVVLVLVAVVVRSHDKINHNNNTTVNAQPDKHYHLRTTQNRATICNRAINNFNNKFITSTTKFRHSSCEYMYIFGLNLLSLWLFFLLSQFLSFFCFSRCLAMWFDFCLNVIPFIFHFTLLILSPGRRGLLWLYFCDACTVRTFVPELFFLDSMIFDLNALIRLQPYRLFFFAPKHLYVLVLGEGKKIADLTVAISRYQWYACWFYRWISEISFVLVCWCVCLFWERPSTQHTCKGLEHIVGMQVYHFDAIFIWLQFVHGWCPVA